MADTEKFILTSLNSLGNVFHNNVSKIHLSLFFQTDVGPVKQSLKGPLINSQNKISSTFFTSHEPLPLYEKQIIIWQISYKPSQLLLVKQNLACKCSLKQQHSFTLEKKMSPTNYLHSMWHQAQGEVSLLFLPLLLLLP